MNLKSWKVAQFAACLSIVSACGTAEPGTGQEGVSTPPPESGNAGMGAKPTTGAAGAKTASAGSSSPSSAGTGGAAAAGKVTAVAVLEPFMAGGATTGAAGASAGAAGASSSAAGSGGQAAKAGSGGSGGSSTGSAAGAGGAAAGSGAGAGIAAVSGTATFTKISDMQVDVAIEVTGCEDGKSYPVHIHEGTSCESAATQGAHWGAPPMPLPLPSAGATAAAGASGSAGHDAGHAGMGASAAAGTGAAGTGASAAAGTSGGAAGSATAFQFRGEGIMDIKCTGTKGTTMAKRNAFDKRVTWTIGTMTESDVVGHVVVVHDGAARIACGKIEQK